MNRYYVLWIALTLLFSGTAAADERLNGVGQLIMAGRVTEARAAVIAARDAYVADGNQAGEASAWLLLSMCDASLADGEAGRADLQKAAAKFDAVDDRFGAWLSLWTLAQLDTSEGQFGAAAASHDRALAGLRAAADPKSHFSLDTVKLLAPMFGLGVDALGPLATFPDIVKPILLQFAEVMSRDGYGHALVESGQLEKAEEQLQQAVAASAIFGGLFDSTISAHVGDLRRAQWRLDDARMSYMKALEGTKALPATSLRDNWIEVEILGKLADVEMLGGKLPEALAWNDRALKIVRASDNARRTAEVLADRGTLLQNGGRLDEAAKTYNDALQIATANADTSREASIHSSLGALYMFDGSYGTAAKHLEKSIELYQTLKQPYLEAPVWTLLAEVDMLLGAQGNAADALQNARVLAKKSGFGLAGAMVDVLSVGRNLMTGKAAPEAMEEAFKAWWELPEAKSLMFNSEAQRVLQESLRIGSGSARDVKPELVATAGPQFLRWTALTLKGRILYGSGKHEEARKCWLEALAANPSRDHRAGLLALVGASYWSESKAGDAIAYFTRSADALEASAADVKVEELLAGYLGSNRRLYFDLLIEMLVKQGRFGEAFAQAERARARAFLQLVGNHRLSPEHGADPTLVREAESLRTQIVRWEQEKSNGGAEEAKKLEAEVRQARVQYQTLLVRLKVSNPEYASVTNVEPVQLDAIRESLPAGAAMISYFVSAHFVHAWVIDRAGMNYVLLPLDEAKLQRLVCWAGHFSPREQSRSAQPFDPAAQCNAMATAEDAYDGLVAPLLEHLHGAKMLVLVPHGVLHYVPFAALRNRATNRYLVQDYTLIHAPSASALRFLHAKETPVQRRALVLGNPETPLPLPPLPGAAMEANAVAEMFGTTAHLGAGARESLLYNLGGKVGFVHIAAHATYDGDNPLFSRVALAPGDGQDGSLTLHEILSSLDLTGVNLVVLSACRSAVGARSGGDEVVGLTRALLYAGTPNVISTLWNINDTASAGLMTELYRRLTAGVPAAEALRQAQSSLLENPVFSDPKYWAAFTLSGDPQGWSAAPDDLVKP
jgi:CHAT domain-containing protein/tetratricopeptide (TPR) repeat protein